MGTNTGTPVTGTGAALSFGVKSAGRPVYRGGHQYDNRMQCYHVGILYKINPLPNSTYVLSGGAGICRVAQRHCAE